MKLKKYIKKEPKCFYYILKITKTNLNKIYILNYKIETKENKRSKNRGKNPK
jgi:hypothetical protein